MVDDPEVVAAYGVHDHVRHAGGVHPLLPQHGARILFERVFNLAGLVIGICGDSTLKIRD